MKYLRLVFSALPHIIHDMPYVNKTSKHPENFDLNEKFYRFQRLIKNINHSSFHAVFYISGQEKLPKGQVLFTPNHTSNGDPITMVAISDRPIGFMAKKEATKMPIIGKTNIALNGTFIDREDLRSEILAIKNIESILNRNNGLSYVIFPEGTRSLGPDFKLGTFHPGSFKVAVNNNLPICPVALYLTDRILNPHYHYHAYPIQVRFLTPLYPKDYENLSTKEIADKVQSMIAQSLEEMKKSDPVLVKKLNHYSDKKLNRVLIDTKHCKKR